MTARENQRPVHPTRRKDIPTPRQQQDRTSPDTADATTVPPQPQHHPHTTPATDTNASPQPATQRLTAYIHSIVDTAPAPTPAQLERLAGLLRDTGDTTPTH